MEVISYLTTQLSIIRLIFRGKVNRMSLENSEQDSEDSQETSEDEHSRA